MRRVLFLWILSFVFVFASSARASDRDEGLRLFRAQRYPEARAALEAALRQEPGDAAAAACLGRVFYEENELDRAATWLEKAVSLDPASATSQYWLGRAYGQQAIHASMLTRARLAGKIRRAFARAVELDPANLDARIGLLEFYLRAPGVMGGSLEKARSQAAGIRERDGLRGHRAWARIHEVEKHPDLAAEEYERAIREYPNRPEPYSWMEWDAIDAHNWPAALRAMNRLLAARPDDAGPLFEIGKIAALSGADLDRGEASLRKYLGHEPKGNEPSTAMAHERLAQILERRGEKAPARDEYSAALRLDPSLREAREGAWRLR